MAVDRLLLHLLQSFVQFLALVHRAIELFGGIPLTVIIRYDIWCALAQNRVNLCSLLLCPLITRILHQRIFHGPDFEIDELFEGFDRLEPLQIIIFALHVFLEKILTFEQRDLAQVNSVVRFVEACVFVLGLSFVILRLALPGEGHFLRLIKENVGILPQILLPCPLILVLLLFDDSVHAHIRLDPLLDFLYLPIRNHAVIDVCVEASVAIISD